MLKLLETMANYIINKIHPSCLKRNVNPLLEKIQKLPKSRNARTDTIN